MISLEDLHVKQVFHKIDNGVTGPLQCLMSNNALAVVKYLNNCQGNRVLINEWVAYNIATAVGITMPPCGICTFDAHTEIPPNAAEVFYRSPMTHYGPGFYSTFISKSVPNSSPRLFLKMDNRDELAKIIVLDHLIVNTDRNPGNLIFRYAKSSRTMHVIDHSHVFPSQTIWDVSCLRRAIDDREYFGNEVITRNSATYSLLLESYTLQETAVFGTCEMFSQVLSESFFTDILKGVPPEWEASAEELNALLEYLCFRLSNIQEIGRCIMAYKSEVNNIGQ